MGRIEFLWIATGNLNPHSPFAGLQAGQILASYRHG
jgi:hypothetical protein